MKRINEAFKHISEREAVAGFLNMCFGPVGIVSGNVSTNIQLTYAAQIACEGYAYSVAAVMSGTTSGHTVASGQARLFGVWLNSAGSMGIVAGSAVSASAACYLPSALAASRTLVGLVKVSMASTVSFTTGTNAWGSGASLVSCTVQYWDVCMIPQGVILAE